jgi:hypothetical protein
MGAPVRHAEVNARRSIFCSGLVHLRAQAALLNLLRSDTPRQASPQLNGVKTGIRSVFLVRGCGRQI